MVMRVLIYEMKHFNSLFISFERNICNIFSFKHFYGFSMSITDNIAV